MTGVRGGDGSGVTDTRSTSASGGRFDHPFTDTRRAPPLSTQILSAKSENKFNVPYICNKAKSKQQER